MPRQNSLLVSVALLVFALLWCAHALFMPSEHMIGDRFGYDPGSRFLPLAASVIAVAALLFEIWRCRSAFKGLRLPRPNAIVMAHMAALIAYVGLFRSLGFILASVTFILAVTAMNLRFRKGAPGLAVIGAYLAATLFYAVVLFSALRLVQHQEYALARSHDLPVLREPALQAGGSALLITLALAVIWRLTRRLGPRRMVVAAQTAIGVTFFLYVIFRQLFFVQLPAGLLNW